MRYFDSYYNYCLTNFSDVIVNHNKEYQSDEKTITYKWDYVGLDKEKLKIEIKNDVLHISYNNPQDKRRQKIELTYTLPEKVLPEFSKAVYKDGELIVTLQKAEHSTNIIKNRVIFYTLDFIMKFKVFLLWVIW